MSDLPLPISLPPTQDELPCDDGIPIETWRHKLQMDLLTLPLNKWFAGRDAFAGDNMFLYQIRIPEYYWYDPFNPEDLAGFVLQGSEYVALPFDGDNNLTSPSLGLKLVRWQGSFNRVEAIWLRWANKTGELLPTEEEIAQQAQQEAQQERQRAELLAERLRQAGIDPDSVI